MQSDGRGDREVDRKTGGLGEGCTVSGASRSIPHTNITHNIDEDIAIFESEFWLREFKQ